MRGHGGVEVVGNAEAVVEDHRAQGVDATLELFEPGCGALQAVGGADVIHEEPVDGRQQGVIIQPLCQEHRVARREATVAADVHIPAGFSGDDAHVFAAGFCALARASRHPEFELVG